MRHCIKFRWEIGFPNDERINKIHSRYISKIVFRRRENLWYLKGDFCYRKYCDPISLGINKIMSKVESEFVICVLFALYAVASDLLLNLLRFRTLSLRELEEKFWATATGQQLTSYSVDAYHSTE